MSCTNRFAAAAALVGLLGMSSLTVPAAAQDQATIVARAIVSGFAPLTAQGVNDLNFRTVTAGTSYTPLNLEADAGRFTITGEPATPVTVTFTILPSVLTSGSTTIPILFGAADGLLWNDAGLSGHTTFDPRAAFPATTAAVTGNLFIGITGTVSPPVGSITGNYTGTIQLTVAYQ